MQEHGWKDYLILYRKLYNKEINMERPKIQNSETIPASDI